MEKDISTEEKIKETARRIFLQKGFAATRTRDIAEEAGINLALLNYYFRSKEKLFELVMQESLRQFFAGLKDVLNNTGTSIEEKIDAIAGNYIDLLSNYPNLPLFVLSNMQADPGKFFENTGIPSSFIVDSLFFKQLKERLGAIEQPNLHPVHIILNVLALSIFPFIVKPVVKNSMKLEEESYKVFIEERRRLIPLWVKSMLLMGNAAPPLASNLADSV